jgi:hypothetical protein
MCFFLNRCSKCHNLLREIKTSIPTFHNPFLMCDMKCNWYVTGHGRQYSHFSLKVSNPFLKIRRSAR